LESVPCNLCGREDAQTLFESPADLAGSDHLADFVASTDRYDRYGRIVRCRGCGLVFTNPRPSEEQIRRSYAMAEDHEYADEDCSRSINAHMSLFTIRKLACGGRLLDVGCATGYFLNAARLDFDVMGVELSRWAAEHARTRLGLNIHCGTIDDLPPAEGPFDVLTLNDVIEHVTDPQRTLHRAASLLRPGGILYLITPDVRSLSARILRGRWWGFRPAHLYYFSADTLSRMLERAGLEPVLIRSYGRIFTYRYWLSRIRNYPAVVYRTAAAVIRRLRLQDEFLYLNTRDSLELCARRVTTRPAVGG
jgi:2-polyprenyl-3-methyl-5-hydroxy-6-metoxy-1,4-benzoquinol methylase